MVILTTIIHRKNIGFIKILSKSAGKRVVRIVDHVLADGAYKILVLDDQFLNYFNQFVQIVI